MDELKKAYETLGLSENASREEVEKEFERLLRRSRSKQSDSDEYEQKLKAYKTIVEYEGRSKIDEMSRERFGKWGKFAGTAEKVDDFLRINKGRIIFGMIAVIVVIAGTVAFMNHREEQKRLAALPPVDLSIMFLGNYTSDQEKGGDEGLEQAMTQQIPEWKRLEVTVTYLPPLGETSTTYDMAFMQKASAVVATEKPDVYILDKNSFQWIGGSDVLESLDEEVEQELKPLVDDSLLIKGTTEDNPEEHIYGIKVSDTELAKQLPLFMEDMFITIRLDSDNKDKAVHLIKRYLESKK